MAHIFQLPSERGIDYYNRKDFYSIVLQAVVREDLRFIDIFAGSQERSMMREFFAIQNCLKMDPSYVEMVIC